MAVIVFESRVNMQTVPNPVVGGFVIAYDTADGLLKQKDSNGVITLISGSGSISPLNQVLALGNRTGTSSIIMDQGTVLQSGVSGGQIKLDNGILNSNYVSISTDNNALLESYLLMNATSINIKNQNSGLTIGGVDTHLQYDSNNKLNISSASFSIVSGGNTILQFNNNTTPISGSKISGIISSENSYFSSSVSNSLILGGNNIIGSQSNTVYTPNLYVSSGIIGNTMNASKLRFTTGNEIILDSVKGRIGVLSSTGSNLSNLANGIFLVDTTNTYTSPNTTYGVIHIGSKNVNNTTGLQNTVVIGGDGILATSSNTVYLGGTININNEYNLPLNDGGSGQYLSTDGNGNLIWNTVDTGTGGVNILLTSSEFRTLAGEYDPNTTYIITDADPLLYGGSTIYLSTDANGILNTTGLGKFFNPKYNKNINGFGIYTTTSSYSVNDHIIWGGYVWKNITGTNNTAPSDVYTLSNEWSRVEYNDSTVSTYYEIVYDTIKYDITNDRIVYRNENNLNIVDTSLPGINFIGVNPIKAFQWGNQYEYNLTFNAYRGIGNQRIVNSLNENINFIGTLQYSIYLQNSLMYATTFNYGKEQRNFTIVNSTFNDLVLDYNQNNISLDNYNYDRSSLPMSGDENDLRLFGGSTILNSLTIPTGASAGYVLTSDQDGLSYWTASIGYDETAVHLTGNETITDTKSFTDNSINTTAIEALKGNTSGNLVDLKTNVTNAGGTILNVSNSDSVDDSTNLLVLNSGSASTGIPFSVQKNGSNVTTIDKNGNLVVNTVAKTGGLSTQYLMADGSVSTGTSVSDATTVSKGIVQLAGDLGGTADLPTTPTALHKTGDEIFTGSKSANNTGDTLNNGIILTNAGTTNSVSLSISTGTTASGGGQNIYNYGTGTGLYIENRSGVGTVYNSTLTGDLIQFKKNNILVSKFDQNGRYSLVGGTSSHFLTSDGGTASVIVTDATTTVKGIVKLAGDLGGTADLPTTPTALHKTGNETFSGIKTGINNSADTKINLTNNGTGTLRVLEVNNTDSGYGAFMFNSANSTGKALALHNGGTSSNSNALYVSTAAYNGVGIYLLTTGTVGTGQLISIGGANIGLHISSGSSNTAALLESTSISSADLLTFKNDGATMSKFDQFGRYSLIGGLSTHFLMADGSTSSASTPDATTTLKGIVKLAGDLGGTADLPTTPTALHKTGDESWSGIKSSSNSTATQSNGLSFINFGTTTSQNISITNTSTGRGIYISNNNLGAGHYIDNISSGTGIYISNSSVGRGGFIDNTGSGDGLFVRNTSSGRGIIVNSTGTGSNFIGQNNGTTTFIVDRLGNITGNSFIKTGGLATEYLMADGSVSSASTPDATTTLKGIVKLAGDLGGTADLPTTPTALHKTGNETFSGLKIATNAVGSSAGLILTQTSTNSSTQGMLELIKTGSNSPALSISNTGNAGAAGMHVTTANSIGININGTFSTVGSSNISSTITGTNPSSSAFIGTSDGPMTVYIARQSSTGTGYNYLGYSASNISFSVDKAGNIVGNSFIKIGGTNTQFLMADGSISSGVSTPDATISSKGIVQLTGDLGGTAIAPTTPTALHKTGNEYFTGVKGVTNSGSGSTQVNGISLYNNATNGGNAPLIITNASSGTGIYLSNNMNGYGIIVANPASSPAIFVSNSDVGTAFYADNTIGRGIYIGNSSTGHGIVSNASSPSTSGFLFVGQNQFAHTFTVDKLGNVTALAFKKNGGTFSQYLMADGSVSTGIDATTTTKGNVQLTGDLGGFANAPTTPTALHKTGNESFSGYKTIGTSSIGGIQIVQSPGYGGVGLYLTQNNASGSVGQSVFSAVNNSDFAVSAAMALDNNNGGYGFQMINRGAGSMLVINSGSTASGFHIASKNNSVDTFTLDKLGNVTALAFKKTGGTSSQSLMADGSVSTVITGTFSPGISSVSGLTTPTVVSAFYTRINNMVSVSYRVMATASAATSVRIYQIGLPYSTTIGDGVCIVGVASSAGGSTSRFPLIGSGMGAGVIVNFDATPSVLTSQTINVTYYI